MINSFLLREIVHIILLPVQTLSRKQQHMVSLGRKPFFADGSLGRKQEIAEVSAEAKYDGQSHQEAKMDIPYLFG